MAIALRPVLPFDLSRSLGFLCGFGPTRGEQTVSPEAVTKAVSCDGAPVGFRVRDGQAGALDVELFSERPLTPARERETLGRIRAFLGTDDDVEAFYGAAAQDPAMAPLVERYRGLHHVRFASPFEAACWGVINQRIGLSAARRMKEALVRRAGRRLVIDGVEHRTFPEPAQVLALGEAELAAMLPGRRARAVVEVARAFAEVDPDWLLRAPIADVRGWLHSIYGVGTFTASFVLYRALGRFDGAHAISPKLVAAAEARYGRPMSGRDVGALADSYGAWGGYWMLYLWASTFLQ